MAERKSLLGIDIGGTKCSVCLGTENGDVLDNIRFPTNEPDGPERCVGEIIDSAKKLRERHRHEFASIGVSCGSPLDSEKIIIQSPPHLPSWKDVRIGDILKDAFGDIPVFLENDANAGALAEHRFGAGRGTRNMLFLTFGTGLGAGLILNGSIYRGACGLAGELGHIRLEPDGPGAPRKAGSFEGFCSGNGIAQLARMMKRDFNGETTLPPSPTARDVGKGAEAGDELCLKVLEASGEHLGRGLAIVIDLLNPERIVIGSIFRRCERFLRPPMERVLAEECMSETLAACEVVPAELDEAIGDHAALAVASMAFDSK